MFTLKIDTENAAFEDDNKGPEVARILRWLADQVEGASPLNRRGFAVRDVNGNSVGTAELS